MSFADIMKKGKPEGKGDKKGGFKKAVANAKKKGCK